MCERDRLVLAALRSGNQLHQFCRSDHRADPYLLKFSSNSWSLRASGSPEKLLTGTFVHMLLKSNPG
ncbi:hypothetical protein WJX77_005654 [Trebouxia sp. C0004]